MRTIKKSILIFGSTLFLSLALLFGCQSSASKVENAEKKVENARENLADSKQDLADSKKDLYQVKLDTISNYEQFKIEAEKTIEAQDKMIIEYKARLAKEKNEFNADYNKRLIDLENKNNKLRNKLVDYKDTGIEKWNSFKKEFSHDMNEIGKAFKDITIENVD